MSSVCQSHFPMDKSVLKLYFSVGCNKTTWDKCHLYMDWVSKYYLQLALSWGAASPITAAHTPHPRGPPPHTHLIAFPLTTGARCVGKLCGWKIWGQSDLSKVTVFINILSSCIWNWKFVCSVMDLFWYKTIVNCFSPNKIDAPGRCGGFPEYTCIFLAQGAVQWDKQQADFLKGLFSLKIKKNKRRE